MEGTATLSKEQKAGALALIKQFEKNYAHSFFEYLPVEGHHTFLENGVAMTIPEQLKILEELGRMELGIQIDFLKNDLDPKTGYLTDPLHNICHLSNNPSDEEQEAYQAKLNYGTVMVISNKSAIDNLRALCKDFWCELVFLDEARYYIKCFEGSKLHKIYHFPALQKGKRPQIITNYALNEEGVLLDRKTLNVRLKALGAATIGDKESVSTTVFAHDKASLAVLSFFFDIQPGSIMYRGPIRESLSQKDIDVFEQYCKK